MHTRDEHTKKKKKKKNHLKLKVLEKTYSPISSLSQKRYTSCP